MLALPPDLHLPTDRYQRVEMVQLHAAARSEAFAEDLSRTVAVPVATVPASRPVAIARPAPQAKRAPLPVPHSGTLPQWQPSPRQMNLRGYMQRAFGASSSTLAGALRLARWPDRS